MCALLTTATAEAQGLNRPKPAINRSAFGVTTATAEAQRLNHPKPAINRSANGVKTTDNPLADKGMAPAGDTVWCTGTKKQHGWFMPKQIITKEQAQHVPTVVRFTHPDGHGHYLKMETINAYGDYMGGVYSPYIFTLSSSSMETDSTIDRDWAAKLNTACVYEFVPDPIGQNIVQERAYDAYGAIIYTFSHTPIEPDKQGHKRHIGTYRDCYGLPADMRRDEAFTFGTLVRITEDQWGNDSIIEHLDGKGRIKPNQDAVPMQQNIYNSRGDLLKGMSCDSTGMPMLDNWGNCGYVHSYNNDGDCIYSICIDEHGEPMPMPNTRSSYHSGTVRINYRYDDCGRIIEETFTSADGNEPATNIFGAHRIECELDDRGYRLSMTAYGVDGQLAQFNADGFAKVTEKYDSRGRKTEWACFGHDGRPFNLGDDSPHCRERYWYDDEGSLIAYEEYYAQGDEEMLLGRHEKTDVVETYVYYDGSRGVITYDYCQRPVSGIYYLSDGTIDWMSVWDYEDGDGKLIQTLTHMDDQGQLDDKRNGYAVEHMVVDSLSCVTTRSYYDAQYQLKYSYKEEYESMENTSVAIKGADVNAFGIVCRAGNNFSGKGRMFKTQGVRTPSGKWSSNSGRDEFGEPDYIEESNGYLYYYFTYRALGYDLCYDENGNEIVSYQQVRELRDTLHKVMSIEVTDSSAYSLGLRDNDVVLVYGGYTADLDSVMDEVRARTKWDIYNVLESGEERRMVVFRVDPVTLDYGVVDLGRLRGTPSQLGFHAHLRFLTRRQLDRINGAVESDAVAGATKDCLNHCDKAYRGDNEIALQEALMFGVNRISPYPRQVRDASLLLSCSVGAGQRWTLANDSIQVYYSMLAERNADNIGPWPAVTLYLTRDLQTVETLTYESHMADMLNLSANVNTAIYERLLKMVKKLDKAARREEKKTAQR